ncbi:MAG: DUF748 domain-containing protein, partial [Gammaproteobacteria bacterium]
WLVAALLAYTLAGFFLVPWVARTQIVERLQTALALPVELEELRFNPWSLRAEAQGFAVREIDDTRIVGFDRLVVNLQVSSLFSRALVLREVTLEQPFNRLTRQPDGTLNVAPLIDALTGGDADPPAAEDEAGSLRLLIGELNIVDGQIDTRDETLATPFTAMVGPININVNDLTTLPDRAGRQRVSVETAQGTRLDWSGTIELEPLISEGSVTGSGPYLPLLYQYFQDRLNFELTKGAVELAFDYRLRLDPATGLSAELSNANTTLRGATIQINETAGDATRFVTLPVVSMVNGAAAWPEQTMHIDALEIEDAEVAIWRDANGVLNLQRLLVTEGPATESATVESAPPDDAESGVETDAITGISADASSDRSANDADDMQTADDATWDLELDALRVDNLTLSFSDRGLADDNAIVARNVALGVQNLSNRPGQASPVEFAFALDGGGDVKLAGEARMLPAVAFQAQLDVAALSLAIAQPWLAAAVPVAVESGQLDLEFELSSNEEDTFTADGSVAVRQLVVRDTLHDEQLLGWQTMAIDQVSFSAAGRRLALSQVTFEAPYARVRIEADETTNFESLLSGGGPQAAPAAKAPPPGEPLEIAVGKIIVADGSVDFTDLALPLPFAAKVAELEGEVTTVSTVSAEPTRIGLAGRVGEYGLAEVDGRVLAGNPIALTDVDVRFRNIAMPKLSPYTVKFAGRAIDAGRIDLDLGYTIEQGRLNGENNIVIRELKLGDKVDSKDAADLPLGLAVALLTGPDGTIDLDLPIAGNVDDPEFSVGSVVMKAFGNLIAKLVTSPFRLLGSLVGAESDDFGTIEFRAGEAELTPPEQEKLARLAEALAMRPALGLVIAGVYTPQADTAALKRARVEAAIDAQLQSKGAVDDDEPELLMKRRRKAVEALIGTAAPDVDLAAERAAHQRPEDATQPEGRQVLDEPAYVASLEARLIEAEEITNVDLDDLATTRAQAVSLALGAGVELDASRVTLAESSTTEANESGWVPMTLDVQSGGR